MTKNEGGDEERHVVCFAEGEFEPTKAFPDGLMMKDRPRKNKYDTDVFASSNVLVQKKPDPEWCNSSLLIPVVTSNNAHMVQQESPEGFNFAMVKSAKSQAALEHWDNTICGLKRSHCKTYREITRSRCKASNSVRGELRVILLDQTE